MPATLSQEYQDKRTACIAQADAVYAKAKTEKRDLTNEENAQVDKWLDESDDWKNKADAEYAKEQEASNRLKRYEESRDALKEINNRGRVNTDALGDSAVGDNMPGGSVKKAEQRAMAMQGWFLNHTPGASAEDKHREAAAAVGLDLNDKSLTIHLPNNFNNSRRSFFNALGSHDVETGGGLVPETFSGSLEKAMIAYGGILRVANVLRTAGANPLPWPTVNDTTNTGRQLGENKAATTQTDPTFGVITFGAYKFTSDEILAPFELLRDNAVNLERVIGELLGERLGRILNTRCTTGTGAATIKGIVTAATLGKTASATGAVTLDELMDLQHSVDPAHRVNASWMMNDAIIKVIRKLEDDYGVKIWEPSTKAGVPDQFLGQFVNVNQDMASALAASAKPVLNGDFSKYMIRQVGAIRVYRLTEKYRDSNDADAFVAYTEADGNLLNAGSNPVKYLQMAAS